MDEPRSATLHSLSRRTVGPAEPVKARPAHLSKKMSPEEAFRITLSDCLAQMTANAATLRAGRSVEGLHQLRVGFRRLEVALGAFAREFEKAWLEELRGRAKVLSSRLGPARDLDVFIDERLDRAVEPGDRALLAPLRARAEEQRDIAWRQASDCVAGPDFLLLLDDIAGLAHSRLPLAPDSRLPRVATRILTRQYKRALKRGRAARSHEAGDLHRLRIALKKLRYTAEFFATLYPAKDVQRYVKKIRGLQEHLGEINDIAHMQLTISALLQDESHRALPGKVDAGFPSGDATIKNDGDMPFAAGMVAGWYRARRPPLAKKALKHWDAFRKLKPFWA